MFFDETLQPLEPGLFWVLCLSIIIAFLLAFSVGANDVSNSFGTSVGAKVITVTQACILATFFEVAGSTLLGYSVCDTFRRNIYNVSLYEGKQRELMFGALACIMGSAIWNLVATALKMPISGTHSIIGATIGFSIVLRGFNSIEWFYLFKIVSSWFISPLFAGLISSFLYIIIFKTIINKKNPLEDGLKVLPYLYGFTIFINVGSIIINGPTDPSKDSGSFPWYTGLVVSLVIAATTICFAAMYIVPKIRNQITDDESSRKAKQTKAPTSQPKSQVKQTKFLDPQAKGFDNAVFQPDSTVEAKATDKPRTEISLDPSRLLDDLREPRAVVKPPIGPKPAHLRQQKSVAKEFEDVDLNDSKDKGFVVVDTSEDKGKSNDQKTAGGTINERNIAKLFATLQIMTACFASFAHGTNDVSNAVAPLVPIWNIYANGYEDTSQQTPVWILMFGGIGICTGLWAWGRSVMETVGDGLTKLTPAKGFAIELGAAMAVLTATKFGMPISTTHCKVGSVVIVGLVSSKFLSLDRTNMVDGEAPEEEKAVDWKLFGNIAITWIVTVPFAALSSAIIMWFLSWLAL